VKNPASFRCPVDRSCANGLKGPPRVRSYSENQAIGCPVYKGDTIGAWLGGLSDNSAGNWQTYAKESDVGYPGPSGLFIYVDEHPDSINDGAFAISCAVVADNAATWVDHPTCLHGGACSFSFVDGHSVIHKWHDPQWKTALRVNPEYMNGESFGQNTVTGLGRTVDLRWCAEHTSALKSGVTGAPFPFTQVPD